MYTSSQMRIPAFLRRLCLLAILAAFVAFTAQAQSKGHLLIYSIDVEGGQSTLLVSPSGASLLVDTGWPDNNFRDTDRIQAAMKDAGITKIDHVQPPLQPPLARPWATLSANRRASNRL